MSNYREQYDVWVWIFFYCNLNSFRNTKSHFSHYLEVFFWLFADRFHTSRTITFFSSCLFCFVLFHLGVVVVDLLFCGAGDWSQRHCITEFYPKPFSFFILKHSLAKLPRLASSLKSSCSSPLSSWDCGCVLAFLVSLLFLRNLSKVF